MRKNMLFRTFSVLLAVALFAAISPAASDLKATRLVSKWTNDGRGRSYAYINNSGNLQKSFSMTGMMTASLIILPSA